MKVTKLRQKIFLILFGLIVIPLLFEICLHAAGSIYYRTRIKRPYEIRDGKSIRILCVGDSFTFGHGATAGYSYPEQLEKMLNKNNSNPKFIVYNQGICGENSSQLLKRLPKYLEKYEADISIVLTGMSNSWNLLDSNYFLFKDSGIKTFFYRADAFLSRLRSYKLLKIAIGNLKRILLVQSVSTYKSKKNELKASEVMNDNQAKMIIDKAVLEESKEHFKRGSSYWDIRKSTPALKEFQKALEINPNHYHSLLFLGDIYDCTGKDELAVEMLKKALESNPNHPDRIQVYNLLWRAHYHAGKYKLALEEIRETLKLDPNNESLRQILRYGLPSIEDRVLFSKLLEYDLENIIKLTKTKGAKIILLNYPHDKSYDEVRKKLANKYRVLFVDNAEVFTNLARSDNYIREEYFREDCHSNNNGYRIMAENVYKVLKSEILGLR